MGLKVGIWEKLRTSNMVLKPGHVRFLSVSLREGPFSGKQIARDFKERKVRTLEPTNRNNVGKFLEVRWQRDEY